ncbi:hypothetical protein CPB84DRAFT_254753 [Gymnopilus junonius]|uniref:Uncharacterized protein n=1 Tax=Gymnopilus junonius TaxID=109634 RepID=A0A9P5THD8_GYMJU|nr:hypothetical protein CPB84DRAFT_254753 [Gymnopilus junonius]
MSPVPVARADIENEAGYEGKREHPVSAFVLNFHEDLENSKDFAKFWQEIGESHVFELSSVELNTKQPLCCQARCLTDRATAVFASRGRDDSAGEMPMVCKVYHPEVQRRHEGLTMEVIYKIAEEDRLKVQHDDHRRNLGIPSMFNHLPKFYFYGDVKGTSTQRARSMVNQNWKGHRTMRIIGMKKLTKITTLNGWDFVKAWLEGVVCHSFLWQNFVEHGDPSLDNLMYDEESGCGVLTDFDLSCFNGNPVSLALTERVLFHSWHFTFFNRSTGLVTRNAIITMKLESFVWILRTYSFSTKTRRVDETLLSTRGGHRLQRLLQREVGFLL